jgi:hypothetical protein
VIEVRRGLNSKFIAGWVLIKRIIDAGLDLRVFRRLNMMLSLIHKNFIK